MIKETYTIRDFLPLITLFSLIGIGSAYMALSHNNDILLGMRTFMAATFLSIGALKLLQLKAFAEAYRMYDLLAKKSMAYSYAYPFIEIALGASYALNLYPTATNLVTIALMGISAVGVYIQLQKREKIMCACFGTVFKIPMTWVTFAEDIVMAAMALLMLILL
jgi:hypothetical protein